MRQQIFELGLSVEAVSLYLVICALQEAQSPLSRPYMASCWTASDADLDRSLVELQGQGVLEPAEDGQWRLLAPERWRPRPGAA